MSATDPCVYMYILLCADGMYYVGSTTDVAARLAMHNAGRGPRFTACRRPVTIAYSESFQNMEQARNREIQIKKWSRAKKRALIGGDLTALHNLSRRATR